MSPKSTLKIEGEPIIVSPQLLFQRLVVAANGVSEDFPRCSPSNYPSSMFDTIESMLEA